MCNWRQKNTCEMGVKEEIFRVYQGCIKKPYGSEGAEKMYSLIKLILQSLWKATCQELYLKLHLERKKKQTFQEWMSVQEDMNY